MNVPDKYEQLKSKVVLYIEAQRFDVAEKLVKTALDEDDTQAHLHHLLGLIYHKQSRFVDAIKCFRAAIRANPAFVEASLNLAITLCDLSQYEEAFKLFEELKKQNDFNLQVPRLVLGRVANLHVRCGQYYNEMGMLAEAIHEYRRALTLFPQMLQPRLELAKLYFQAQEFGKVKKELEEILAQKDDHSEALTLLGLVHQKEGQSRSAVDCWTLAQRSSPDSVTPRILIEMSKNLS